MPRRRTEIEDDDDTRSEEAKRDDDDDEVGEEAGEGAPRKERVLHTRVPVVLEEELKRLATNLRVPVSNVVRAILEDAVAAVDRVGHKAEGELRGAADRLARFRIRPARGDTREEPEPRAAHERGGAPRPVLEGILGWQPLLLAADGTCTFCGRTLAAGTEAFLGVRDGEGPRVLLGPECLPGGRKTRDSSRNLKSKQENEDD